MSAELLKRNTDQRTGVKAAKPGADAAPVNRALVISIITVRIEPRDAQALLDEAIEVLQLELKSMPGFLSGEILISLDTRTLVIRTEWTDDHAWGKSRYDNRVGIMLEHCNAASKQLEVEIYVRHATFTGPSPRSSP